MIIKSSKVYPKARPGMHILYYELAKPVMKETQELSWRMWLHKTFPVVSGITKPYRGFILAGFNEKDVYEQHDIMITNLIIRGDRVAPIKTGVDCYEN